MNVSNKLPSFLLTATPDAGVAAPAEPSKKPQPALARVLKAVDGFDGAAPTPVLASRQPAQLASEAPAIPVSALIAPGSSCVKRAALVGPKLLNKPIETETTPLSASKGTKAVSLDVPWYSQFSDHGTVKGGNTSCNAMVKEMMASGKNVARPGGRNAESNFNIADAKDNLGRITPNTALAAEARTYLDEQLDAGKPVMVGVMWRTPNPGYNDGNADHYVVVTGRGVDDEGRVFYKFHDPGSTTESKGSSERPENRFLVDAGTGVLYRPGLQSSRMYTTDARYEVSQVRKNQ